MGDEVQKQAGVCWGRPRTRRSGREKVEIRSSEPRPTVGRLFPLPSAPWGMRELFKRDTQISVMEPFLMLGCDTQEVS